MNSVVQFLKRLAQILFFLVVVRCRLIRGLWAFARQCVAQLRRSFWARGLRNCASLMVNLCDAGHSACPRLD
jgi:hypothetical protein